jgi:integrase
VSVVGLHPARTAARRVATRLREVRAELPTRAAGPWEPAVRAAGRATRGPTRTGRGIHQARLHTRAERAQAAIELDELTNRPRASAANSPRSAAPTSWRRMPTRPGCSASPGCRCRTKRQRRSGFFDRVTFLRVLEVSADGLADFVEWAFWTGMRRGEMAKLTWADFDRGVVAHPPRPDHQERRARRPPRLRRRMRAIIARRLAAHEIPDL